MGKNDSISIPVILKVGPNALDGLGKCLADEDLKQVVIYFGNGLIDLFGMKVMESLKESGVSVLIGLFGNRPYWMQMPNSLRDRSI